MMIAEITELKNQLVEVLSKYGAKKPDEIEGKIIAGEITEHPSYEDYLSALSYEQEVIVTERTTSECDRGDQPYMRSLERYKTCAKIAENEFSDILKDPPMVFEDGVHLLLRAVEAALSSEGFEMRNLSPLFR